MNPSRCDVLIVDDEVDILNLVRDILTEEGYRVRVVTDGEGALKLIEAHPPTLMLLDIWLGKDHSNGLEVLDSVKRTHPNLPVIMISGHGTIETAVSAIKKGAYEFIEKPFNAARLLLLTRRAIEAVNLKRENQELRLRLGSIDRVLGVSNAMNQLRQTIEKVAPTSSRVLITGPSGTGKEVTARLIHAHSKRSESPFVALNAAAMTPKRMETELFGVEGEGKIGAFEQADGGTLFLDEIADMPLGTQGKILRVLVEQTFERVGGNSQVQVDVRVMSSSSRNIEEEIEEGRLRGDLFHRLNVVPVRLPPLCERREDIPELVEYMARQFSMASMIPYRPLAPDAIALLQAHDWPGNIRQLRNNVERIIIMAGGAAGSPITASMLPAEVIDSGTLLPDKSTGERLMALPLREARQAFEREYLLTQMNRFEGNVSRTASFIGMERSALHRKIKLLGVESGN
ncbi:MAG: sigma-54 dependent transcriptional regulator [Hyphomicrobiales bacterium]|nr:sigma-54 dependent transcriptional regulator [Hyphomicrobiales bacterium]MCY4048300.1 sigma-54 dependent transcriptional regulator [Hyphomicrobiales bacterium]MCY4053849.1 sigma-54 dependent transcriptional regulator [Hyphomicrobiales bacterium]